MIRIRKQIWTLYNLFFHHIYISYLFYYKMADYDIFGNIAIIKGEKKMRKEKIDEARELLKKPGVLTVLEKATNVSGRLRTIKTKHILGKKNKIAELKENGCIFRLDVESCYFSPRLSNERQIIASKIKRKDKVLVMFAGVGVYPVVIYHYSKPEKIIGVELGRECCKYFEKNIILNKMPLDKIKIIQGDVKKKVDSKLGKFDVVIMARPNLSETFLKWGLLASRPGTRLFYYGFCKDDSLKEMVDELLKEAVKYKRKLKVLKSTPAGEIAPYKHRFRIEFKVLN
jgi:tRNA (guanine37-N1)-methyltransferase